MTPTQIIKIFAAIALIALLVNMWSMRRRAAPAPYDWEHDEDMEEEEEDDDEDMEEEEDDDDEDMEEEDDDDEDMEEDDDDEDMEEDDDDDDDDEDMEDDEQIEGFANTPNPSSGRMGGAPLMSVATDLLPKPSASARQNFGEFAPKSLLAQNFLDAKKYIGVDTQGSSLRNANYDLRASPAIPRKDVGPWSQSTIDGDLFRKPVE